MDKYMFEYLKLQYEEGGRILRYWIECRYKILQFVGYFNAAVLTIGFSQNIILSNTNIFAGLSICILSIFVAVMGLSAAFSITAHNSGYFETLRKIENEFNNEFNKSEFIGIITHSGKAIIGNKFHEILPVHRAHKIFYSLLCVFWAILLICHTSL